MDRSIQIQDDWDDKAGIDLHQLWNVISRFKWAILALAFIVTLLAALVVFAMTPMYAATSLVHIQSEQANIVSIQQIYGADTRSRTYYDTQAEILKSRPIAARVLENVETTIPAAAPTADAPKFSWRSLLPFKAPEPPGGPVQEDPRERQITSYLRGLVIQPIRGTQLVKIGYASPDPRLAATYANAHADAYIESMLDAKVSMTASATSWISRRVDELRENLRESERTLQTFREQEELIDAGGIQGLPTMEVNDLTSRLADARRQLSSAKIAYLQVYGNDVSEIESVPKIVNNTAVREFRSLQAKAEQQVAELARRYGPKHPKMIAAQSELAEANRNLASQQQEVAGGIRAEYLAAQAEVQSLESDLARAKAQYQDVSRKGSKLAELQREVETNRQLYELFYNRLRETAQTDDLRSVNARVVQPAVVPTGPFAPNKRRAVLLAFVISLAAGVGAALLLDRLNNTIRSSADVEDKIGLPLLGMVPLLTGKVASKNAGVALFNDKAKGFSESIRTVRTGLSLSNIDHPHKVILVTSSIGSEGKSTIAMNLALAFAQMERVLLLDADLRRPSVAREFGIDRSKPGLSELLARQADINSCVTSLEDYKLDVLKTGLIPPNPLELLSSEAVSKLVKVLRNKYDRIIIDSPPVLPVSDAAVLSAHVDALVYVIKSDSTAVTQIKNGLSQLRRFNAPITGIVVNQLDIRKAERYSDYGYGGYYEYYEADGKRKHRKAKRTEPKSRVAASL